eukprot:scaffold304170_cov37-Prasinocladus_malaysianus.AAC.1
MPSSGSNCSLSCDGKTALVSQAAEDQLRKEKKEEMMGEIRIEMAQDEYNELERDFKSEKSTNLKAVK